MAAVGPLDEATVIEAVASVKRSDIKAWTTKELGQSVQSQRRQIKKIVAKLTDKVVKMGQDVSGIFERATA